MPLRHLTLKEPQYVPQYNTLDANLVAGVAGTIQQQSERAMQEDASAFGEMKENTLKASQSLPEEFQGEMMSMYDESRARIDDSLERRGPRATRNMVRKEAQELQQKMTPYQRAAQQSQDYQERLKQASQENNVDTDVRNYLEATAGFKRDEDGNPIFQGRNLNQLDNWRDLHDVARETIKDIEANIEESGVHLPEEDQAFYQRMKRKYRDFDRLQLVGLSRLLNDQDAVNQMELSLEAQGYVFDGNEAYVRTPDGELEHVTVEEDGEVFNKTKQELIREQAAKHVNPTAAARAMSQQTYSYTAKNSMHFAAMENDAGGSFMVEPKTTIAGRQEINNPVALDQDIEQSSTNYQQTLDALEQQGIIQKTSDEDGKGYRVVEGMEGEYNSRRANLKGMREHIESQSRRRERLQVAAFRNHYGDEVNEDNIDDYIYEITEGSEEFQEYDRDMKRTLATGPGAARSLARELRVLPNRLSEREIVENVVSGETPESLGYHHHLNDRQIEKVEKYWEQLKNTYEKNVSNHLSKKSPEYKTYVDLLKEDAKGRNVEVPVTFPTNDDVLKVADNFAQRVLQPGELKTANTDVKWLNTNKAHESIYESGEFEDVNELQFGGFSYHPDTGENIAVYAAVGEDGKAIGSVYAPATESFKNLIPTNDQYAKESYYNNMINVAGSSPSREGSTPLLLNDVEEKIDREVDINVRITRPMKTTNSQGMPIVQDDDPEVRLSLTRGGREETHTFATTNEAMRYMRDLEESIRNHLIQQHREKQQ